MLYEVVNPFYSHMCSVCGHKTVEFALKMKGGIKSDVCICVSVNLFFIAVASANLKFLELSIYITSCFDFSLVFLKLFLKKLFYR